MKTIAKLTVAAGLLFLSAGLGAQTFKCKDAYGKITYSGKKCSDLGLKDAGEVKDKINMIPAPPQSPSASTEGRSRPRPTTSVAPDVRPPEPPPPAAEDAPNPDRRCFVVNTPKGKATRCNDVPDPDNP